MGQKKTGSKNIDTDSPDVWEFMAPFFLCVGCSSSVCLYGTVRPASCIRMVVHAPHDRRLCPVLSYATVVSINRTNIIKAEESRRLHVVLYWSVCSMYTQSPVFKEKSDHT